MHAGCDHGFVQGGHGSESVGSVGGNHLGDGGQGVDLVAGVDPLRGVAHVEVLLPGQAGFLLQDGHAHVFGHARVDRGLKSDGGASGHVSAHGAGRRLHRRKVGLSGLVNRRGHGHDDVLCLFDASGIGRGFEMHCFGKTGSVHLAHDVDVLPVVGDLFLGQIESDGFVVLAELDGQGQADIAETDDCDGGCIHYGAGMVVVIGFCKKNEIMH